jgi:hypothetical protein
MKLGKDFRIELSDACCMCLNKGGCSAIPKLKEINDDFQLEVFVVLCNKYVKYESHYKPENYE